MANSEQDDGPRGGFNDSAVAAAAADGPHDGMRAGSLDAADEELHSPDGPHDSDDAGEDFRRMEEMMVEVLCDMKPLAPDIIRAVPAGRALRCCGRAFRRKAAPRAFHGSVPTDKIKEFWSHSWHGNSHIKVVTALFLNNGKVAPLIATAIALIAVILYAAGILPMRFHGGIPTSLPKYPPVSYWAKAVGFVVFCICLLCWQPARTVFVDVLCINQYDRKQKSLALFSMPAFLKASESLLVLWDPSYTGRLWCCFEIAAFLRSRASGQKARVTVRPTLLGPVFVSLPIALSVVVLGLAFVPLSGEDAANHAVIWPLMAGFASVAFYWSVTKLREFFRSVDSLHRELQQFQCKDCLCYCCAVGHRQADGRRMACDRRVINSCITLWFGSVENFDSAVRSEVLACLTEQLSSQVLTYKQFVVMAVPVIWHHLDTASSRLEWIFNAPQGHTVWVEYELREAFKEALRGIGWAFGILPIIFFVTSKLACWLRGRAGQPEFCARICSDIFINLSILVSVIMLFVAMLVLESVIYNLGKSIVLIALAVFDLILFLCARLLFTCVPIRISFPAVQTAQTSGTGHATSFMDASSSLPAAETTEMASSRPGAVSSQQNAGISL
ncbi:unnamed protein product [Symbiodinium natans]|uniref:Uncharacterized protein n=1 Tax=Symbiodinium natans TaxID=878477 RepID=A0A812V7G5_9DINO|nr:unnamed protein product [Symbiodinium natans]